MNYDHKSVEKEVQEFWKNNKIFESKIDPEKKKFYILDMFPYPSGDGLHVGHVKGYSASDAIAHYKRLNGYNVLHPMGWDAFGLPAENYAIKIKKNPADVVKSNIESFKSQLNRLGFSYDWSREINTTDPNYYKWTQWIFIKLFEKGLAYQDEIAINFCPSCKTGLANEEVISGECERCHSKVEKKKLKQWILRITKYADRLLEDLDGLDWPEPIKEMQRNWIGKSEGTELEFEIKDTNYRIKTYTTRVDTLFGVTYLVLSPENELIEKLGENIQNLDEVKEYQIKSQNKSDLERTELKEKTGVELKGLSAIHPLTGENIPVWIADYVLASYGTGAVMAVPAHDDRDFEFAEKNSLPIKYVVRPSDIINHILYRDIIPEYEFELINEYNKDKENYDRSAKLSGIKSKAFVEYGKLINSEEFNGLTTDEAKKKITEKLQSIGKGNFSTNYKLRDWIFSRQRYWGEPIPIVHCEKCGPVALDVKDLPLELPRVESYEPSGNGESPLANIDKWVNTTCPKCSSPAKRETNTMPQWAGSCWYYLRFADQNNNNSLISSEADNYYLPVDFYIGGAEHAVLHLLYARFWHKFLFDEGIVKDKEPFTKLKNVGLILAPDNQKMSKSRGNVINPDDLIEKFGADALRMYELFIGPFDQPACWNTNGISGTRKFLDKVINNFSPKETDSSVDLQKLTNDITKKLENNLYNTAVSDFMKFVLDNDLSQMSKSEWKKFLCLLTPFAPHLSEYLNLKISNDSIFTYSWPNVKITNSSIQYVVQINGKHRANFSLDKELDEDEAIAMAKEQKNVKIHLEGKNIKKTIYVKNKVINFVV